MSRAVWNDIRFQARVQPSALAVCGAAGPITYQALVDDVESFATELLERALTRQDVVGIQLGFSYLHLLAILALDRLSIPSMSFATRDSLPDGPALRAQYGVTAMIAADPGRPDPLCRWIQMAEQHRPTLGKPDGARLARIDSPADGLVRVSWSSGTTGSVKGSPVTRMIQAHRLTNRRLMRGLGPRTRYYTGMPLSSSIGYVTVLAVLSAGGVVILPDPGGDFVSLANALGATLTSGAPAMLTELLGESGEAVRRLETMRCFEIVGAPLPAGVAQDARVFLTPHLWVLYGSTETGPVATADAVVCDADPSAVGVVMPWVDLEIVDADDRPLPIGQEGRLRVRGAQVAAGYRGDEAGTQRNFRDGWFHPGDLGMLTASGLLRVTGRAEDVITHDGVTVAPLPLEEMIRGLPGIRDVAVFALPGADGTPELGAALVLDPGVETAAVGARVRTTLGDRAAVRVFMIDSLPRNANGKVMRHALAEMAQRSVKR